MRFRVREILKAAEEDYERAWRETAKLLQIKGGRFKLRRMGRPNPIFEIIERGRHVLLEMGFEEMQLPIIVDEAEVRRQYGPEANVILDRCFYLAKLPRPEIGLDARRIEEIRRIVPDFERVEELKGVLRRYKEGKIEADDLIEVMVTELGLREEEASAILDRAFPEFKALKPIPSTLTLRSHTTSLWFPVLSALQDRRTTPLQLFHIGPKFRREERLDASHLYTSYTISVVIMDEELALEDGLEISREILRGLGFPEVREERKRATSKYYAPGTEYELFVKHSKTGLWVEVGNAGLYSPVSLAQYGIEYPVFNVGFGVERMAMIETGEEDIRALAYPYFYREFTLTDEEIAKGVRVDLQPETPLGREIMESIIRVCEEHRDDPSPVVRTAWEGRVDNRRIRVEVWEEDPGVRLLGPAAFNEVWVLDGSIVGTPPDEELRRKGVSTGIRYVDAIAARAARLFEEVLNRDISGEEPDTLESVEVRVAKLPSDVNLRIERPVRRFVSSKQKRIDVRGPVFMRVRLVLSA
ncbi:O-phosphoserine--tRNA ligase [Candidatus Bathyarchaeota archaeon]|nr:O-phosphoserine--tRNA ligase [Candidatus Bathyarchaeota archaeon]